MSGRARALRQGGATLVALLALIALGAIHLLAARLSGAPSPPVREEATARALAQAKQALIGRAMADNNRPGTLSCPDMDGDGDAESPVAYGGRCPGYVGRLPWKTLRLPELRDESGERLWYALSPSLRDHGTAEPVNSATAGSLTVDGTAQIAAIVIAAGPPLAGQSARPSNSVADYLDGTNGNGDLQYTAGPLSEHFNDRLAIISRDELFAAVARRVLAAFRGTPSAGGLLEARAEEGLFPWADADADSRGEPGSSSGRIPTAELSLESWLGANAWAPLVSYSVQPGRTAMSIELNGVSLTCTASSCP